MARLEAIETTHADGHIDYLDHKAVGGDLQSMPKGYYRSLDFIMTFIAICFASICAYLGWHIRTLIDADIGPSKNLNWVATTWTLGSAIGFLLVGRLSDIFGRKWMVLGCQVLGTIGMIVGATAQTINTLIGANMLNGIAAAGQLSFGFILGELVSNKHRGIAVSAIFFSSMPFAVFGPSIARAFILHTGAGWRWSYYLGIIISTLSGILYQFFYHPPRFDQLHMQGKTKWQQFKELDFIGIVLFIGGTVVFLIGFSWGGSQYPWKSTQVICTLVIGGLVLVGFGLYEQFVFKGQALMPPRMFRKVSFVAIIVVAVVGAMVYYSLTILWPSILVAVYGLDTVQVGLQSSVVGGGILLGQCFGGIGLSYIPKVKWQVIFFSVCGTAFVGGLACLNENNHATFIALGVMGTFVIGWVDLISFTAVTLVWEPQDIGLATGVLGSIRALGGAVAQSLYVSILTNKLTTYLPKYVVPAATNAGLPSTSLPALFAGITAGSFTSVPGITPAIISTVSVAVRRAYIEAFHIVFYSTIPFGVCLIIAACFVPDMKNFLHGNVARRLQGNKKNAVEREPQTVQEINEKHAHHV
ncbi:fungal trichothecene efflux pump [Microthyrium microscopicum]|uniref:Fungal trichothecene efflux pump n=1 Tax=Microthyrium microscopicum TaxID=703497 RepID=A0A6A6UCA1_9PEZI|nr:fungal trichothecene efflux pump [Microthyrium microscopicum]